jgi:hypothetical protein
MSRTLATAAQEALGRDPGRALAAIKRVRQELDELEEAQVGNALSRGWTWARIGRALGVSRQAVHRKYSSCTPLPLALSRPMIATNLRLAITIARTEAATRGDVLVGTEHLLLGVLQQGEGCAADALRNAGASLRAMRFALDLLAPTDLAHVRPSQIGLTRRASRVIDSSARIAVHHDATRVTEKHVLRVLLLQSPSSGAISLLLTTGVKPSRVKQELDAAMRAERQPALTGPTAPV